jgi:hypothetical protein
MEIFLDNQKLDIQIEIADTIDTIVKSVEEFAKNCGKVVVEIKIDGNDIGNVENSRL